MTTTIHKQSPREQATALPERHRQQGCAKKHGNAITENVGGEPLTRRESDLLRLGAICQAALNFWPRQKALSVIRQAENRQFATENYAQSYVSFIVEQIAVAMRDDGAEIRFVDDYLFDIKRGRKPKPHHDPYCPF